MHIIIRMFIFCFLALWLVGFQMSLCFPIGNTIPGSYIVTSGLHTKACNGNCLLVASWYMTSCPVSRSCEGKCSFLYTVLSFSGCKLSCCLAALDMVRSDLAHLLCEGTNMKVQIWWLVYMILHQFLDNSDSPSIVEWWSQKTWCSIITSLL